MRSLLALVLLALPAIAHADSFLVMANEDGAHQLEEALRPILADHGISITSMPSPTGAVPLERAAAAQRAAHEAGARAVVWIEGDEIYAVTPDAERVRHASVPTSSPNAFAKVATNLVRDLVPHVSARRVATAPEDAEEADAKGRAPVRSFSNLPSVPPLLLGLPLEQPQRPDERVRARDRNLVRALE